MDDNEKEGQIDVYYVIQSRLLLAKAGGVGMPATWTPSLCDIKIPSLYRHDHVSFSCFEALPDTIHEVSSISTSQVHYMFSHMARHQ